MKPIIQVARNHSELETNVENFLNDRFTYLLNQHGTVNIGVSGGSMVNLLGAVLPRLENHDWNRIRIFLVDERNVHVQNKDSNYGQYVQVLPENILRSFLEVPIKENPQKTACLYELLLRSHLMPEQHGNTARFDIILLGVGPDGHTASLFPGRDRYPKLSEYNWVTAISDSPKPPSKRITLTPSVLNHGKNVAFIITGKEKAPIVKAMAKGSDMYPASQVRPINNKIWYFLDVDAASELPQSATNSPSSSPIED